MGINRPWDWGDNFDYDYSFDDIQKFSKKEKYKNNFGQVFKSLLKSQRLDENARKRDFIDKIRKIYNTIDRSDKSKVGLNRYIAGKKLAENIWVDDDIGHSLITLFIDYRREAKRHKKKLESWPIIIMTTEEIATAMDQVTRYPYNNIFKSFPKSTFDTLLSTMRRERTPEDKQLKKRITDISKGRKFAICYFILKEREIAEKERAEKIKDIEEKEWGPKEEEEYRNSAEIETAAKVNQLFPSINIHQKDVEGLTHHLRNTNKKIEKLINEMKNEIEKEREERKEKQEIDEILKSLNQKKSWEEEIEEGVQRKLKEANEAIDEEGNIIPPPEFWTNNKEE